REGGRPDGRQRLGEGEAPIAGWGGRPERGGHEVERSLQLHPPRLRSAEGLGAEEGPQRGPDITAAGPERGGNRIDRARWRCVGDEPPAELRREVARGGREGGDDVQQRLGCLAPPARTDTPSTKVLLAGISQAGPQTTTTLPTAT